MIDTLNILNFLLIINYIFNYYIINNLFVFIIKQNQLIINYNVHCCENS